MPEEGMYPCYCCYCGKYLGTLYTTLAGSKIYCCPDPEECTGRARYGTRVGVFKLTKRGT